MSYPKNPELMDKISDFAVRLCHVSPDDAPSSSVIRDKGIDFTSTGVVSVVGGVSYVSINVSYVGSVVSQVILTLRRLGEPDFCLSKEISPLLRESKIGLDFHIKELVYNFMVGCGL